MIGTRDALGLKTRDIDVFDFANRGEQLVRVGRNADDKITVERGRIFEASSVASWTACSFASSKSRPCSISSAPNERIAAFFSVELPCGTTIATATLARVPAKASEWP